MRRTSQKLWYTSKFFTNTQLLSRYWCVTENNDLAQVWRKAICDAPYFQDVSTYEPTGEQKQSWLQKMAWRHTGTKKQLIKRKTSADDDQAKFSSKLNSSWSEAEAFFASECWDLWQNGGMSKWQKDNREEILGEVKDIKIRLQVKR